MRSSRAESRKTSPGEGPGMREVSEVEVTVLLGRQRDEHRVGIDAPVVYCNERRGQRPPPCFGVRMRAVAPS